MFLCAACLTLSCFLFWLNLFWIVYEPIKGYVVTTMNFSCPVWFCDFLTWQPVNIQSISACEAEDVNQSIDFKCFCASGGETMLRQRICCLYCSPELFGLPKSFAISNSAHLKPNINFIWSFDFLIKRTLSSPVLTKIMKCGIVWVHRIFCF